MNLQSTLRRSLSAALLGLMVPTAWAWTDKPIKLIVPAPAGGTMDVIARLFGDQLSADLGQPVIIDNKPGAGGAIGIRTLVGAPADGQTLMVTASNVLTEIPNVMKVPFDPLNDVKPVGQLAQASLVLVTPPATGAKDLKGLIAVIKAKPGQLNYATYSAGTVSHYASAILAKREGLDMQHVPFAGSPPALAALMGGQVSMMFDGVVTSKPQIQAGKLVGIAVGSAQRSKHLPDLPTMTELGYPEIAFSNWLGVVVSSKVSPALTEKIHAAVAKVASNPKVSGRLNAVGFDAPKDMSAAQLAADVKAEYERNAGIVKQNGITMGK